MLMPEQEALFGAYKDALLRFRDARAEATRAENEMAAAQARDAEMRCELRNAAHLLEQRRNALENSLK